MKQKKPELLAPAGNMEKLKMAILYGADAVYLGGENFGLRAQGGNFSKQELAEAARSFLCRAGALSRATLLVGQAEKLLSTLSGLFDLVFIDAAKSRYPDFWLGVQPLLTKRAVVVADNVLFRGLVEGEGSEEWPKHSYRTMVLQLREYLRLVRSAPDFQTEVFPEGDGMAVSWRNE